MTKVSESQLLSTPGLQPLRAELLASASQFYEDILKKDPNNPDLQAGLAAAFYRVGLSALTLAIVTSPSKRWNERLSFILRPWRFSPPIPS